MVCLAAVRSARNRRGRADRRRACWRSRRAQKAHHKQKSEQARHFGARQPRIGGVYLFPATVYATAGFRYKYIMSDIVTHNAAQTTANADAAAQPVASVG